ncbi:MAG: leucyl/phenylalanyl-tRNA--protein transferase [Moraxellaceae bacterium]
MPLYRLGAVADGFPPPEGALDEPNGLLAVGGDLSPARLLAAYRQGIFPWFSAGDPVCWWSPDPRCVFLTADYRPARSLVKTLRKGSFQFSVNRCFTNVMQACAAPRPYADSTWIQPAFIASYSELHAAGHAHSIEVWDAGGDLVGGLYGISLGRAFFGESMFSRQTDASKAAFCYLMQLCRHWQIPLVDGQVENPHLMRQGAVLLPRADFLQRLAELVDLPSPDWHRPPPFGTP